MTSSRVEAVLTGASKRRTGFTQDEVAELFVHGRDGYETSNLHSRNGVLIHYSTIEAIRLDNGTVIENTQCWSQGWAHCPHVQSQISLPLTHIEAWFNKIGVREDLSGMKVTTLGYDGNVSEGPNGFVVELGGKYIAIRKREYPSHWNWLFKIGDTIEAMRQESCGNTAVKIFATDGDIEAEEKRLNELEEKRQQQAEKRKAELYRPIHDARKTLKEIGIRTKISERGWRAQWVTREEDEPRSLDVRGRPILVEPYLSLPRPADFIVKDVHRGVDGEMFAKVLIVRKNTEDGLMDTCLMGKDQSGPWVHFLPRLAVAWGLAACDRWLLSMQPGDVLVASS